MDLVRVNEFKKGMRKVDHRGGTFVTALFFDPTTGEYFDTCVRDYDYSDCSRDNDALYYMPIDEKVRHIWLKANGVISVGDYVEVYKGRKLPKGYKGTVKSFYDWRDNYGRIQTRYVVFANGDRTSVTNCRLIEE